jgi:hypothetical protein
MATVWAVVPSCGDRTAGVNELRIAVSKSDALLTKRRVKVRTERCQDKIAVHQLMKLMSCSIQRGRAAGQHLR